MSEPASFRESKTDFESCDTCDSCEGHHYCLLHTFQLKNANLHTCDDWTVKAIPNIPASDQLRQELHNVIRRYGQESEVTVYQAMGVLDAIKMDLWDDLEKVRRGD